MNRVLFLTLNIQEYVPFVYSVAQLQNVLVAKYVLFNRPGRICQIAGKYIRV